MNRCPRIYCDTKLIVGETILLPDAASHHLLRVLRAKPGQGLTLFDGKSSEEYSAEFVAGEQKQALVKILAKDCTEHESPLKIFLGQGISRGERMDYTLQKSVELGVHEITPLFTERCGVDLAGERVQKRVTHWQQVVIAACEQSGRCYVPQVKFPQKLEEWLKQLKTDLAVVADPRSTNTLHDFSENIATVALLCGPEGGFSEHELELTRQYQMRTFSLGPRILRTETAALTAISLMQYRWGDLSCSPLI